MKAKGKSDGKSEALAQRSEAAVPFRVIVESVPSGLMLSDEEGRIVLVNSQLEAYFGYDRSELIGNSLEMLIPQRFRGAHPTHRAEFQADPRARTMGVGRDLFGLRKDGSEFPVEVGLTPVKTAEGSFVLTVIVDITDRKSLEQKILEISEIEKRRIGRDIHDDVCQQLAGIGCLAKVLEQRLDGRSAEDTESIAEIGRLVGQAHARAREVARGLVTGTLESEGLARALEELASSTKKLFAVSCICHCDPELSLNDRSVEVQLYRIAQEAISNAVRHGQAKSIELELTTRQGQLVLVVRDDGVGIAPVPEGHGGMGLLNMSHRAQMVNGRLEVKPQASGGTAVICTLPSPGSAGNKGATV